MHTVLFTTESVQDMRITIGEQTQFSCLTIGREVDIEWIIDDFQLERCPTVGGTDICFENSYMRDTVTTHHRE